MYQITTALKKLKKLNKRIRGVQGGTSASKTISILQILIDECQRDMAPCLTSVTSETIPHLKRGAMRDFKNIMLEHNYWDSTRWNATDSIYTFETGSQMEFFSLDMPHKVRGPRRKRLFINEANNIPYETFDQLEVRTEDEIWLDWNPVIPFWWHEGSSDHIAVMNREDAEGCILTFRDNEGLPESIRNSIEARRSNKNWWKVYGEGQLGEVEGKIYTNWEIIDAVPEEARLVRYGLDFGYSSDPAAIVSVYKWNGGIVIDELLYKAGMKNGDLANFLLPLPEEVIIADSSEPKSIDEIAVYGLSIIPATKGPGSISHGIQSVQARKVWVTKRSTNVLKEYRSYLWQTDKDGRVLTKPVEYMDHAMDAIRYAVSDLFPLEDEAMEVKQDARIPGTYVKSSVDEDDGDFYTDRTAEWGE